MIASHRGLRPRIDPTAYVDPSADVRGDVSVGSGAAVLAGAVLTAEGGSVAVGHDCVIMENAVLRGVPGHPCQVGSHVLIGPGAHLAGCRVDDGVFLATGVSVLNGAHVGALADVRINAVVHCRTRLPPEAVVPIAWVAMGDPAEIMPPGDHERIWAVQRELGFREAAFRMGDLPRRRFMEQMTRRYARSLARHAHDRQVEEASGSPVPDPEDSPAAWRLLVKRLWRGR